MMAHDIAAFADLEDSAPSRLTIRRRRKHVAIANERSGADPEARDVMQHIEMADPHPVAKFDFLGVEIAQTDADSAADLPPENPAIPSSLEWAGQDHRE